jgi:hypothetical protein
MCVQRELYLDVIVLNINKFFPFFKKKLSSQSNFPDTSECFDSTRFKILRTHNEQKKYKIFKVFVCVVSDEFGIAYKLHQQLNNSRVAIHSIARFCYMSI